MMGKNPTGPQASLDNFDRAVDAVRRLARDEGLQRANVFADHLANPGALDEWADTFHFAEGDKQSPAPMLDPHRARLTEPPDPSTFFSFQDQATQEGILPRRRHGAAIRMGIVAVATGLSVVVGRSLLLYQIPTAIFGGPAGIVNHDTAQTGGTQSLGVAAAAPARVPGPPTGSSLAAVTASSRIRFAALAADRTDGRENEIQDPGSTIDGNGPDGPTELREPVPSPEWMMDSDLVDAPADQDASSAPEQTLSEDSPGASPLATDPGSPEKDAAHSREAPPDDAPAPLAADRSVPPQPVPGARADEAEGSPAAARANEQPESAVAASPAQPPSGSLDDAAPTTADGVATGVAPAPAPGNDKLDSEQESIARALADEEAAAIERERANSLAHELARVREELDMARLRALPSWLAAPELANGPLFEKPAEKDPGTITELEAAFLGRQGTGSTRSEQTIVAPIAPVAPSVAPSLEMQPPTPSASPSNPVATQRLVQRAESLLAGHDISGARLLLERAVELGSARAAYLLAQTYDPRILDEWRIRGVRGDFAKAAEYYSRAKAGGVAEAGEGLSRR